MKVWVDAQLSPSLAEWLEATFNVEATAVRDLGLRDAEDETIFYRARAVAAVVLTKDIDFVLLLERLGPPPQVIWLTCGNTSNRSLCDLLQKHFSSAKSLLQDGEPLVEIS